MDDCKNRPTLAGRLNMGDDIVAMEEFRQPPYLLAPWLRRGSIALLHAQPGTKKTYLALNIALAVSRGAELLGWKPDRPNKPRRVLYLDAEMPMWLLRKRLLQLSGKQGIKIMFLSRENLLSTGHTMPDLASNQGKKELNSLIEYTRPDLVVLDSLSALIRSGSENEREPWLPIEDWLQRQRARQCAVLMVHHQGKSGLQRGTSAREEVCDAIMSMRNDDNGALRLTFDKLRDYDGLIEPSLKLRLAIGEGVAKWHKVSRTKEELGVTKAQVLELLEQNKNVSEIARSLKLHRKTVQQHISALKRDGWHKPNGRGIMVS